MEERFAEYFANWNIRLPVGAVQLREPGAVQQDGWTIRYVFGNDAVGPYLEFYATHRMTNDRRTRIYASGEAEHLEAFQTMYGYDPKIPGDEKRAARENRRRNTRITKELEAHGLYPHGNINAYLATHDVPRESRVSAPKPVTPGQRQKRKGHAVEALVAGYCILASDGELNVATSLVDDEGVDLVFFRKAGEASLSVQVKAGFTGSKVVDRDHKVQVDLKVSTFEAKDDFFILVVVVDPPTAEIMHAWLIPSVRFAAIRSENTTLRFAVSLAGTVNRWDEFRVAAKDLASEILKHLDQLRTE